MWSIVILLFCLVSFSMEKFIRYFMLGTTLIAWYKAMRKALFVASCHHYDRATKSL